MWRWVLGSLALATALVLSPWPGPQLLGGMVLLALPGYWAGRLFRLNEDLRSPLAWSMTIIGTLTVVPIWLNAAGWIWGLQRWVVLSALVVETLLLAGLVARVSRTNTLLKPDDAGCRLLWLAAALGLFLAFLVLLSYAPILTADGLPWVTMGDWDKHGAVIWALTDTGIPPQNKLLYMERPERLSYYYFFHLLSTALHVLTQYQFDLRWMFAIPAAALAAAFPVLFFALARNLLRSERTALVATGFLHLVGGLDWVAVALRLRADGLPWQSLESWMRYLHIDEWADVAGLRINVFYVYFLWVPQHLAGLALLVTAWFLWSRDREWRTLRFWGPWLLASMIGSSVYVTLATGIGLGVWLVVEAGRIVRLSGWPALRSALRTWGPRLLWCGFLAALLAAPMLWLYWTGRSPGKGIVLEPPRMGPTSVGAWFSSHYPQNPWWRLLDLPLHYGLELGVGLLILGLGLFSAIRQGRFSSEWRWITSTALASFLLISLFQSSGASLAVRASGYGSNNDLGMRAVMPLQVFIGLLAGLVWPSLCTRRNRPVLPLLGLMVVLGIGATGWEMRSMAIAKYHLRWVIPYPQMEVYQYIREHTPMTARLQQAPTTLGETYLLAQRWPALWSVTALAMTSRQPEFWKIYKGLSTAFETEDPVMSTDILKTYGVDFVLIRPSDRRPEKHPEKFSDTRYFTLVYDNGWGQLYQLTDQATSEVQRTPLARAKLAEATGDFESARRWYTAAVTAEKTPGLLFSMLMEYAIFERFHGTPAAALPLFEQALRLRPDHVEAHVNYGAVLLDAGRAEEAAREFYFVLSKAPDHFWAKYLLGVASIKQNRPIEAFAAFEGALPLAPSDAMRNATVGFALQAAAQINDCVKARSMANLYPQALASAADDVRQFLKKCP